MDAGVIGILLAHLRADPDHEKPADQDPHCLFIPYDEPLLIMKCHCWVDKTGNQNFI